MENETANKALDVIVAITDERDSWQARALAAEVELVVARRDAERARWCEEKEADVDFLEVSKTWGVVWVQKMHPYKCLDVTGATRNAAIDAAMGGEHA